MPHRDPEALTFRRDLRRLGTEAERFLWKLLRRKAFGSKFRRQHPVGPYVLDFYCPAFRMAVELDGGQHASPANAAHDAARTAYLAGRRIRVMRFTNFQLFYGPEDVLETIAKAVGTR